MVHSIVNLILGFDFQDVFIFPFLIYSFLKMSATFNVYCMIINCNKTFYRHFGLGGL